MRPGEMFSKLFGSAMGGMGNYFALQALKEGRAGGTETGGPKSTFSATGTYGG